METIQEYSGTLVVLRCWCGIQHAVPESLRGEQLRQHSDGKSPMSVYCPLGHQHRPIGMSKAKRLENQLMCERSRHDQTKAALEDTERRRQAQKAATTRLKKRASAGMCPCCRRTFQQLTRHMEKKHPNYKEQL